MRIEIFAHYASVPDIGQYTGHYELAKGLVARGHQVTIRASSFSHYKFRETVLKAGERRREVWYDGVRFVWLATPAYHGNDSRRIRNMAIYAWRATLDSLLSKDRPDVCVGVCVHPLAGLAAWVVASIKGAAFVYEIRDLWPTVLIEMGRLPRHSITARALFWLERFLIRRANKVIGAWRHFDRYIEEIGEDPKKVTWIPQFSDLSGQAEPPPPPDNDHPFVVMYTGGIVNFMGIDRLLQAAAELKRRGENDIRLILLGGGQEKERLQAMANEFQLSNVEFRGPVPKSQVRDEMLAAHCFIINMPSLPHHRYGVSTNKMAGYLALARPIIYGSTSTYNPVREADLGVVVNPDAPADIADGILAIRAKSPEERARIGARCLEFLRKYHDRGAMVERLEKVLLEAHNG
jgi:glycosyltransferase involved in cell wall biosynthesis